jgi:hypothetical protein
MINSIKAIYSHCDTDSCHQSINTSFCVKDDTPNKCVLTNSSDATIFVENKNSRNIDFVCVDSCLINTTSIQKCDLVLISNSTIWFVELKEMSYVGNFKKDQKRKVKHTVKAVKQLASTINDFKAKGVDLTGYSVSALISFPPYINETNPISIPSTSNQARINEYSSLCGYVDLYHGNHIIFL